MWKEGDIPNTLLCSSQIPGWLSIQEPQGLAWLPPPQVNKCPKTKAESSLFDLSYPSDCSDEGVNSDVLLLAIDY